MWITDGPLAIGRSDPDRPAIVCGGRALTYGRLHERVLTVAAGLGAPAPSDRAGTIALEVRDPADFLVAFLGIVEAGGVAAPLSPAWSAGEMAAALRACRAELVIVHADRQRDLPAAVRLLADVEAAGGTPADDGRPRETDAPFYIGFSSGSTGVPKVIVRPHRTWLNSFLAMTVEFGLGPGATVAVPGSLFFSFSLIAALQALYLGGTVRCASQDGVRAAEELAEAGADALYILPSLLADLLRRSEQRGAVYPAVAKVICAGEKLPPAVRSALRRCMPRAHVYEYYGASELGFVTVLPPEEGERRPGSVGRPFLSVQVAILDEHGAPLPPGEAGLVGARTEYGFAGYLGDPAGPGRIAAGSYQTVGDAGWLDADGYLHLAGRQDSMVVIRGENVYPEQVEQVLLAIDGVKAAAVVAEPPEQPRYLVACIVAGEGVDAAAVAAACRERLPRRRVPRRIVFVDRIPTTPTGKVARAGLAALVSSNAGRGYDIAPAPEEDA